MALDADEATNALIAKMLAEDDQYEEDMYGLGADDSDDDWDSKRKKKRKGKGKGPAKPKKAKAARQKASDDPNQELSATGRKKRKDTGAKRTKARPWDEEEERKFREALKLYGRDWKSCANHVGTRDARSFTSHAQKYFIKMCLQGKPLPRKVCESGEGYTLSGKPLDPNSAAARAYGFKEDTLEKLKADGLASEVEGGLKCQVVSAEGEEDEIPFKANKENIESNGAEEKPAAKKVKREYRKKQTKPIREPAEPVEPTEYAKNRPRRESKNTKKSDYVSYMSGSLALCPCKDFTGPVGSVSATSQPYFVEVSHEAMLVMDFHAHLSCFEVIGYLGGDWNAEERKLNIRRAFPCKGLEGTQQTDSCEMDPASELEAKDKMDEWGLSVVGWYHSHPTFKPNPSQKDIENQENYQALFHDKEAKTAPFVAFIFSPYDIGLPSKKSAVECWTVKGNEPMRTRTKNTGGPNQLPSEDTKQAMSELIDNISTNERIQLTELWRPFTYLNGLEPEGGPCTKLAKLRGALTRYLPDTDESEEYLDEIFTDIQSKWKVDLGY